MLFDIHYSKYIENLYNNIQFIDICIKSDKKEEINQLINNIKSDLYHFKALLNYNNPVQSATFLEEARQLFNNPNLDRFAEDNTILFYEVVNLYMIRHEIAHSFFKSDKSDSIKSYLVTNLQFIVNNLEKGFFDQIKKVQSNVAQEMEKYIFIEEVNNIISNYKNDSIFEEIFCDYIAHLDILKVYYTEYSNDDDYQILLKVSSFLNIFDHMNDLFRRLKIGKNISISNLIRYGINAPLKAMSLIDFFEANKNNLNSIIKTETIYDEISLFQDYYFSILLNILIEIEENDLSLLDISKEQAILIRNSLLRWE